MNTKKVIGSLVIIIGVVVVLLGFYAKSRVAEAKLNVQKNSGPFPGNPVDKQISEALAKQISAYDAPILWTLIGGAVIIVIGAGTLVWGFRRK